MIVIIKEWFDIIAVNIDHAKTFEEIIYLFFNSLGSLTIMASYT